MIVGVNSDRSVRANKGFDRPITPEAERVEILSAFEGVDAVVVFDEDTPHALISTIQPDVLVKGADWAEDAIVGRDVDDRHRLVLALARAWKPRKATAFEERRRVEDSVLEQVAAFCRRFPDGGRSRSTARRSSAAFRPC